MKPRPPLHPDRLMALAAPSLQRAAPACRAGPPGAVPPGDSFLDLGAAPPAGPPLGADLFGLGDDPFGLGALGLGAPGAGGGLSAAGLSDFLARLGGDRAAGGGPAGGAASGGERDACPQCAGRMHLQELEYVCAACGFVVECDALACDDDGPRKAAFCSRLRVVGPNCARYQPDLDRSSTSSNNAAAQIRQVADEFLALRVRHIEAGGRAFPEEACLRAAEYYNEVQQRYVKRSQNKHAIMAANLYYACIELGFVPTKPEVATLMCLPRKGIARGENFLRSMAAESETTVDVNKDTTNAAVATVFLNLMGTEAEAAAHLQPAVEALVRRAVDLLVGVSSTLRSKVNAAAFVVIQRWAAATGRRPISQQAFCAKCGIRKNTIEIFTAALAAYHSHFADIYAAYGLDASPPPERPRAAAKKGGGA